MQQRISWRSLSMISVLTCSVLTFFLNACGSSGTSSTTSSQHVTLTFSSWQGGAAGDAYQAVIRSFEKTHPTITINYKVATDYATYLNTTFGASNPADIVGFSPGSYNKAAYVQAGDLVDLSDQPWVSHIQTSAKVTAVSDTAPTKVYALPVVQDVGGVIYNKDVFSKLKLQVPTTWEQFLQVCATIKAYGVAPLAIGAKDGWPLEQFLDNQLVNTVYRDTPNFHAQQVAGTATYAGSAGWKQAIADFTALKPYFNNGFSSTTFANTADLLATGKAAMVVNGDFTLQPAHTTNPNVQLGIFPLPYGSGSAKPNFTSFVDQVDGIASKSQHIAEAKAFLQYFAQPNVMASFLTQRQGLATLDNVGSYTVDPALNGIPALLPTQSTNESVFNTNAAVESIIWKDTQAVLVGTTTSSQMLQDMDKAFKG